MSDFITHRSGPLPSGGEGFQARSIPRDLPAVSQYLLSLLMVGAATLLAFVVRELIAAPNLTLIYVLPVVIAGVAFGWGPALAAVITGVLTFDFFFTQPYYSFRIYSAADVWAAALLLVIAALVTTVAADARRRTLEAVGAAQRAQALQGLAHVVIEGRPRAEVLQAAARALHEIFRAPAVIFLKDNGAFRRIAGAGGPQLTPAEEEAARGALADGLHTRGETYPFDQAEFEFWPVGALSDRRCVIGVNFNRAEAERPEKPEQFVDVVAAYLAVALDLQR
jgi:two-component system sensor histidine kinase KdpD